MKLLRLVPVFVLLVTIVSLLPPAYASINLVSSRSNSYRVRNVQPIELGGEAVVGTASIMFTSTLGKIQTKPVVAAFTFTAAAKQKAPTPKFVLTGLPADGYNVSITFTVTSLGGSGVPTVCKNLVGSTQPNTPVTVACKDPITGAIVTVIVTTGLEIRLW